jgi:hypothetical protein
MAPDLCAYADCERSTAKELDPHIGTDGVAELHLADRYVAHRSTGWRRATHYQLDTLESILYGGRLQSSAFTLLSVMGKLSGCS